LAADGKAAQFDGGVTYRVQLNADFGFAEAAAAVGYLSRLGVTHLYCSPIFQAVPGSAHGYDVVNASAISDDLGGVDGFEALVGTLAAAGIGVVVDVVANHMGTASRSNTWWWEVLENGPSSPWASYFDVDWDPPEAKLRQRVLVPVLADHYGRVLEAGEIQLARDGGSFFIAYHDHHLPVSPRTIDELLAEAASFADSALLEEVAQGFARLPEATQLDRDSVARRHHDKEWLRRRLRTALASDPVLADGVDKAVASFNADRDRLDSLLRRQNYRLAWWKVAGDESDYRRFFDISDLVALRMEDPEVFAAYHSALLGLVREGKVSGLRVDHPDGLRDPQQYFERLAEATSGAWVVAEKILAPEEVLPDGWPVAGTTGYDFANQLGGLFVDPAGEEEITSIYRDFTGDESTFEETAGIAKREVIDGSLAADFERLTASFVDVCEGRMHYRDFTRPQLRSALAETMACFGFYRPYVRPDGSTTAQDRRSVAAAIAAASRRRPDLDPEVFDLLEGILLLDQRAPVEVDLAMRFQQLCAAVTAKGVEDTAFYRYVRFVALNEVGGDPSRFGVIPRDFHAHNLRINTAWPSTMVATSTHDSKRSEDVRARLAVLSEIPAAWQKAVREWSLIAAQYKTRDLPDRRAEYLLYQTLVGAYPLNVERAAAYMRKAAREAKLATSWSSPNLDYERALDDFVTAVLSDESFTSNLESFVSTLIGPGRINSLAQTVLKLTSPGVADIYQGCETHNLTLVDPDNRSRVNFSKLDSLLDECELAYSTAGISGILSGAGRGLDKVFVHQRTLAARRDNREAFSPGAQYRPIEAEGSAREHVVSFVRAERVLVVVPRLFMGLSAKGGWAKTRLRFPPGSWSDCFSATVWSDEAHLSDLLGSFPVCVLVKQP
jgi:(1->4)-alpha-D-glucan 1-alpha-D-glucosylmutase